MHLSLLLNLGEEDPWEVQEEDLGEDLGEEDLGQEVPGEEEEAQAEALRLVVSLRRHVAALQPALLTAQATTTLSASPTLPQRGSLVAPLPQMDVRTMSEPTRESLLASLPLDLASLRPFQPPPTPWPLSELLS